MSGVGLSFSSSENMLETNDGHSQPLFMVTDHLEQVVNQTEPVKQIIHPQNDSFLEDVLQSIDTNLENELFGVEMLCRELAISERQLQRKLKSTTNKSPNQLISSVRLHRAKELLLSQKYNISEIAYKTGFSNPAYFSK